MLAIPYCPLYYFLANRVSAVPELAFFDYLNFTREQEQRIMADLERKGNRWIILSNRADTREVGLGVFGKTYCPLLAKYLKENFALVETIGDWDAPPGWIINNAIRIYRKKDLPGR